MCGRTDGRTTDGRSDDGRTDDDGRQVVTIAHPEPCSGELKQLKCQVFWGKLSSFGKSGLIS